MSSQIIEYDGIAERIQSVFNSCSRLEQKQLINILKEMSISGESSTLEQIYLADFKEVPVSIDEFICSPKYLGPTNRNGEAVYPFWKDTLRDIFNHGNKYNEIILSGATRIGKTSTSVIILAYMLYRLMLYRNPHEYFQKKEVSKFYIGFANLTKDLAAGVAYREFNDTLKESPWFNEHGKFSRSDRNFYYIPEGDKIELVTGSDAAHMLGLQIWACLMDETNFAKAGIKDINIAKAHMKNLYDTINARISGTFRIHGEVFGKLIASSSKNSDSDFLSDHIEQQLNAGNTHMLLVDRPQWEILPDSMFSDEKFYFTVGDRYKRGFVVPEEHEDDLHIQEYIDQGYQVIEAPKELKKNFLADYDIALRDIAGISVAGAMGFITQESITPNVSDSRLNPFFTDTIQVGSKDNSTIEQYFHLQVVPARLKKCTMNIHLDLAEVNDRAGICGCVIDGNKVVEDFTGKKVTQPFFKQVFQVGIEAPRGDRMSFQKVVNFLVWLRRNGFNIGLISTDQYQSSYLREILNQQGFDTEKISVDASEDPYIGLKNVLNDQRIELVKHQLQEDELVKLQRLNKRIDHPPNGCFTGETKISLVDGRELSINDLLIEQTYKTNWVYTVNESTKLIEPKPIKKVFQTKLVTELVKVTLDNGEWFECTPEHLLMLRDGQFAQAQTLGPGTSLMPLYTKISDEGLVGYRLFYEPEEDKWHYEHRRFCLDELEKGMIVHHANFNKLDNTPTKLQGMSKSKHRKIHNNSTQDYCKNAQGVKDWHMKMKDSEEYAARSQKLRDVMLSKRPKELQDKLDAKQDRICRIEKYYGVVWSELSVNEKNSYSNKFYKVEDPEGTSARYREARKKIDSESEQKRRANLSKVMSSMKWYTNGRDNIYIKPDSQIPEGYYPGRSINSRKNHKIVSIETIHKCCRVYDLEVVDNHNFALAAGVFVHNSKDCSDALCGSIWTLTKDAPKSTPPPSHVASAISSVNGRKGYSNARPSVFGMHSNYIRR